MNADQMIELIKSRRTIRQFKQTPLKFEDIQECIDAAHVAPSASNIQPLEYIYIDDKKLVDEIFPMLSWAGYIQPNGNPQEGRRPVAYLVVLNNNELNKKTFQYDVGAAVENFTLTALAKGIGSCWLLSVKRGPLRELLNIPEKYHLDCVIALGYPDEEPVAEETDGNIKYYQDENKTLHVPKRKLNDIFHHNELKDK